MSDVVYGDLDISTFGVGKTAQRYPCFEIRANATTPLVVSTLEHGDYQLIGELNGKRKVISTMTLSVLNIDLLLKTTDGVLVRVSEDNVIAIVTIEDYLAVISKWIM